MTAQRILVIDDEPSVITFCQKALEKENFEVEGALTGEQGLRLLKERDFDLTLLDVRLPDDELCRRAIEHLIPSMQFPEITVPVIELDDKQFTSERYTERLSHGLQAEIRAGGETRGHLWVYYAQDRPFLIPWEQNLLNAVAETLGLWLERKRAE